MRYNKLTNAWKEHMLGIFIDTETTGLNPFRHRVLEIAIKVVDLDSGCLHGRISMTVRQPFYVWLRHDPASVQVNGFSWKEMRQGVSEKAAGRAIEAFFLKEGLIRGRAVFIAQNSSFDRGFFAQLVDTSRQEALNFPYHWLDLASMFYALEGNTILSDADAHLSKNGIAKAHGLPPEATPHRAMNGVDHLIACFKEVTGKGWSQA